MLNELENLNLENNNSSFIVKHNHLIEARYSMSLTEQRVLIYVLSKIDFLKKECEDLEISSSELLKMFNLNNTGSSLSLIRKSCKNLVSINLDVSTSCFDYFINIFSSVKHHKGSGIIIVRFSPEIKPYILALHSHFTQYNIESVASFKSEYSIRIYELLKMHQYQMIDGYFYKFIEIERFRKILGIGDSQYKHFNNFETDVLKRAKEEISNKSDIIISYEKIKTKTKITAIKFTAQLKNYIQIIDNNNETEEYKNLQKNLILEMEALGIKKCNIEKWFKTYHIPVIKRNFEYTLHQYLSKKIKNFTGYMNKALEYDFWQSTEMAKIASFRLQNIQEIEQEKYKQEQFSLEQKEIEKKIDVLAQFKMAHPNIQSQVMQRLYKEYPHLEEYFKIKGLNGNYAKDFIFIILKKMKIKNII